MISFTDTLTPHCFATEIPIEKPMPSPFPNFEMEKDIVSFPEVQQGIRKTAFIT
jgi:hypothetical protein